ncbi:MAG: hypothetical protein WBD58_18105 [Geitlerinemataceae cyanobacterium]
MPKSRKERQLEERKTTSHWAISEEACESMEEKYGWTLVETNRDNSNLLPVECVFEGEAEFPKGSIGYSAGEECD